MAATRPSKAFLESGCALIVASVDPDGAPHASRGWGLDVVDDTTMRILVDAGDAQLHANLKTTGVIAITATDVRTLRSVQLKGPTAPPAPGDDADHARMGRYCDAFFDDVEATDGISPASMGRIVPAELSVVSFEADAVFDQTPGPQAGSAVAP